jgi:hypothetical protein
MAEAATVDEYRDVIAKARALVLAWRDAEARPDTPSDEPRIEWFNQWRDRAVEMYNSTQQYLADPYPEMLATRLGEIAGVSRAMDERCEWEKVAPAAEQPFVVFASTIRALWSKFPRKGTPEAAEAEPVYRGLAAEFEPVAPRRS